MKPSYFWSYLSHAAKKLLGTHLLFIALFSWRFVSSYGRRSKSFLKQPQFQSTYNARSEYVHFNNLLLLKSNQVATLNFQIETLVEKKHKT